MLSNEHDSLRRHDPRPPGGTPATVIGPNEAVIPFCELPVPSDWLVAAG